MNRVFDDTTQYCISIEGQDPSDYLLSRMQLLYNKLIPLSQCPTDHKPKINLKLVEVMSEQHIKVSFDCMSFCKYETTFTLQLSAGNWLIEKARHRMQ